MEQIVGTSLNQGFHKLAPGWGTVWYEAEADFPDEHWRVAMRGFHGTVPARIVRGTRSGDVMRPGSVLFFVSERFVDVLKENNFTGWGTYDVELSGGKGPRPPYYGLVTYGEGGPILDKESGTKYSADGTDIGMERLVFDLSGWDGSDIFSPLGSWYYLVTERVARILSKAKLKNCLLRPIEEVSY